MIRAYIGLQGQGKTLSMINFAIKAINKGHRVVSNTPIFHTSKKGNKAIILQGNDFFEDFTTNFNTLYLLDEGGIVFGKYNWKKIPHHIRGHIIGLRKFGRYIIYGTPRFNDVSVQLREFTHQTVLCKKTGIPMFKFWNIQYHPQYFELSMESKPLGIEKQYIMKRKIISQLRAKYLYKKYDTKYIPDMSWIEDYKIPQPPQEADESVIGKLFYE